MKKYAIILLSFICFSLSAQETAQRKTQATIAYWGYNIFHPGLKIGAQHELKNWDKSKKGMKVKRKTLFLHPEIGLYRQKRNHTGLLLNTNIGLETSKDTQLFFTTVSMGLGYFRHFNSGITYIMNDDGTVSQKKWASRGYFLPTLNVGYGQNLPSFSWFNTFTVGSKIKYNTGSSLELFFEAGVKVHLFQGKRSTNDKPTNL